MDEQDYCVGIDYIAEIVDDTELTSLPETDDHVKGEMDLRGHTTTIVNPCKVLETDTSDLVTDGGRTDHRIVVLDSGVVETETPTGWLVSAVNGVRTISEDLLDAEPIGDTDLLGGSSARKTGSRSG